MCLFFVSTFVSSAVTLVKTYVKYRWINLFVVPLLNDVYARVFYDCKTSSLSMFNFLQGLKQPSADGIKIFLKSKFSALYFKHELKEPKFAKLLKPSDVYVVF